MATRPWIAVLLLINYLWVVGMDCVNRPEDQPEFIRLQTTEEGHFYQECRYLRMDGLEAFLTEIMASSLQNGSETPNHHLISVISSVNAHCLFAIDWHALPLTNWVDAPQFTFSAMFSEHTPPIITAPPRRV